MRAQETLRKYLDATGISPTMLSRILNVTPSVVYIWLKGSSRPHPRTAMKLQRLSKGEVPIETWGFGLDHKGRPRRSIKPKE